MLVEVSTKKTVGRVSGLGWGLGYIGGILALVIVVLLTQLNWFGMDVSDGLAYRLIAAGAAVWTVIFALPFVFNVPEAPARLDRPKVSFLRSYVVLFHDLVGLFKNHRPTFFFLIASAVYRDGLAGVFAFCGILGIAIVLIVGLVLMLFVKMPADTHAAQPVT